MSVPLVSAKVEITAITDLTDLLERWTLEELEDLADGMDEDGLEVLKEQCTLLDEDRWLRIDHAELEKYIDYRRGAILR